MEEPPSRDYHTSIISFSEKYINLKTFIYSSLTTEKSDTPLELDNKNNPENNPDIKEPIKFQKLERDLLEENTKKAAVLPWQKLEEQIFIPDNLPELAKAA
ncbi:MAG: hypothetical protein WC438_01885 [Candidatus Pacearchaeota archaeon]